MTDLGTYLRGKMDTAKAEQEEQNVVINDANFVASGHTKEPLEYIETDTPYTIIDPSTDAINVGGTLVEVVGDELVTNGDFDTSDLTQWSTTDGGLIEVENGSMKLTNGSALYSDATLDLSGVTNGLAYTLEVDIYSGSINNRAFLSGDFASNITNDGKLVAHFIANGTEAFKVTLGSNVVGDYAYVKNISVKEIQPILLPNAPFDTDTSRTETTTDLTTTGAVSKGDFVVHDIQAFEFSESIAWTYNGIVADANAPSGNLYKVSGNAVADTSVLDFGSSGQPTLLRYLHIDDWWFPCTYLFKANSLNYQFYVDKGLADSLGLKTLTSKTGVMEGLLANNNKVADEVYQAIEDTALMYDYENDGTSQSVALVGGEVIFNNDGNDVNGLNGHYYKNLVYNSTTDLSTRDYSNTTNWLDLGTATNMSLLNPKFQPRDRVARQDPAVRRIHKTTLAYDKHTFKGTALFDDTASPTEWMTHYFGSPDSTGLWSDATYYYLPLDIFERLNLGAYHPIFNELGGRVWKDASSIARAWYNSSNLISGTIGCFDATIDGGTIIAQGNIGSTAWRPDETFYDKAYINQSRNHRLSAYGKSEADILNDFARDNENGTLSGVDGMVEAIYVTQKFSTATASTLLVAKSEYPYWEQLPTVVRGIHHNGQVAEVTSVSDNDATYFIINLAISIDRVVNEPILIARKSPHTFRADGMLVNDIIGDPANYPQILKDRLAVGKSALINPLLVDDRGNSLIPSDPSTLDDYKLSKKSLDSVIQLVNTIDGGDTWDATSSYLRAVDNIENSFNLYTTSLNVMIAPYTAKTSPLKSIEQGTTKATLDKVYASNSHSIYKGGAAVANGTGKIPTGNGTNGFESRGLENVGIGVFDVLVKPNVTVSYISGDILNFKEYTNVSDARYWRILITGSASWNDTLADSTLEGSANFEEVSAITTTPTHNTIALDNQDSIASKRFYTLELDSNDEYIGRMYTQEMKWDFTVDSASEFTAITSANVTDDGVEGTTYYIDSTVSGAMSQTVVTALQSVTASFDDTKWTIRSDGYVVYSTLPNPYFKLWDGNGFGDDSTFPQLVDGTLTDDNANTIVTSSVAKRLGLFK